jgi:hypothetical protein
MNDAEVAYNELKSLMDLLEAFVKAKSPLIQQSEITLQGNSGDPAALQELAGNLRSLRRDIVADLRSRLK